MIDKALQRNEPKEDSESEEMPDAAERMFFGENPSEHDSEDVKDIIGHYKEYM